MVIYHCLDEVTTLLCIWITAAFKGRCEVIKPNKRMRTTLIPYLEISITCKRSFGSEKRGVALTRTTFLCDDFKHLNVSWWYDWQMDLSYFHEQTSCTDVQIMADKFVPMVWGGHRHINLTSTAPAVLGFNEPNFHSQANLTPAEAVAEWAKLESRSHGRPLVSPAASSCHTTSKCYGDTTEWFDEFFRLCKDCRVDYIATHAYHCHGATTMAYLERLWQRYHRKIWLTEFSCPGTDDHNKQLQYMQELLPLLEAADYVYR
ncbi:uncharacterized protein LOC128230637 [Mya arenaria]|uniref:uncharacterized protein LOC128230637 n=1 Tax=Mya arenaria TaxID=6604 RepID=UPI0022E92BB1|nr:uncharacterized protein LOC128230637 [Mya arenaria]